MSIVFRFLPMSRKICFSLIVFFCCFFTANAQSIAVKTNALYWATATPNIGVEYSVASRWTLQLEGGYNPWTFNKDKNIKAKHFLISPEARSWFCESYLGHFIGVNASFTQFNVGGIPFFRDARREGWAVGAGLTYGCSWPISRCWNIEANIGLGLWYTRHGTYEVRKCGLFNDTISKVAFGPTSLGLSFVYIIK